jgi:hypothetical protein
MRKSQGDRHVERRIEEAEVEEGKLKQWERIVWWVLRKWTELGEYCPDHDPSYKNGG